MTVHSPALDVSVPPTLTLEQQLVDIDSEYVQQHRFLEALQRLTVLAHQNLTDPRVWLLIGFVYTRMAYWKHAISALETVLQLDPKDNQAKQLLSLALFSTGQQEQACKLIDQVVKQKTANSAQWMLRAFLHAHTYKDPLHALGVARDWGKRFADPLTRAAKPLVVKDRNPHKKLKVGYVTADFREHSVAFFMQPVLAHHNPENVEVHVYSNGPADHVTEQLKSLVPYWHDVAALSDDALYSQIRNEGIDILVDLSGFTHGQRLLVFARRAAPVQVTWLGYKPPLGMKAIDYRFFNPSADNYRSHYSEELYKLTCPTSFSPPAYSPWCEHPPMLRNGYITYVSLNNSAKITSEALEVWAKILHYVSDARLLIYVKEDSGEAAQAHMLPRVEKAGLPLARVSVMPQQSLNNFMETGHIADVMLDTFPTCGGTTILHAIWMGMPVISMRGNNDLSNSSSNTINGLGFGGLVASSHEEYFVNAVKCAKNINYLIKCRMTNRENLAKSNLMNYEARARDVELGYRAMWKNFLEKK